MKKQILLLILALLPMLASAGEVEIDGINYYINTGKQTAEVIAKSNGYQGRVFIPASFDYNGVTYNVILIRSEAFAGCEGLSSITIPNSVTSIGYRAFYECNYLTSVTFGNSVTNIGEEAFSYCRRLSSITIPNSVTNIGGNAFLGTGWYNAQADGLLYLDKWLLGNKGDAPFGAISIKEDTKSIADGVFAGCTGLTSVTIPNSVTSIGYRTFLGCNGLTSIQIPNSVTKIEPEAFAWCFSITSLAVGSGLRDIGQLAFAGCRANSITVDAGNTFYDSRENCNAIIESSTNTMVLGCKTSTIPSSVTSIGDNAFVCSDLTSVTIPNGVTSIGENAFNSSYSLVSVTIPNSVTRIGCDAFWCTGWYNAQPDGVLYLDGWIVGFKEQLSGDLTIKDGTKGIATRAFANCYGLTSVTIPEGVLYIGDGVFSGCNYVLVNIPNSVKVIGDWAFYGASIIDPSVPDGVTYIGGGAFSGVYMSEIIIPNSVTYIGEMAFSNCESVISMIENPFEISSNAFSEQIFNNATLYVPAGSVEKYKSTEGWKKFANIETGWPTYFSAKNADGKAIRYYCINETELEVVNDYSYELISGNLVIPEEVTLMNRTWRVTRIGDNAFWGCNGLLSVTIPNSITSIGEQAFAECDIPEIISRIVNPFSISADTFSDNTYSTATLYVPAGTIDKYKAVQGWKKFANIKAGNPSDISNIETKGPQEINRYALNGRVVKGIHKGINIIQMNNGTTKKVIIK